MSDYRYPEQFSESIVRKSRCSAAVVVPLLLDLIPSSIESVADFGSASGEWLAEFEAHGVTKILGVDVGHVQEELLSISKDCYLEADLTSEDWSLSRYDLALSLEVAEYLPGQNAESLVRRLCHTADFVLFSAAIPGQGGHGHLNEQWPGYWERLFEQCGYSQLDIIQPCIWRDQRVAW